MTKFSIIVPNFNTESTVGKCLDSVLEQSYADFECICIDDCSTDNSLEKLQWYSHSDDRIVLQKNSNNVGLGETRNRGVANARGKYILFLDSDDWIRPDALDKISESIGAGNPDLVIFDHYLAYDNGQNIAADQSRLFRQIEDVALEVKKRELLRVFHVAWNKAYNRKFFNENQFRFPRGFYEDLFVTYQAIIAANQIKGCPYPLYYYRQRPGTYPNRPNKKPTDINHMQIFARYQDLFEFLNPEGGGKYQDLIYTKMINQFNAILCERLSHDKIQQAKFFERMRMYSKRYRPQKLNFFSIKDKVLYVLVISGQKHLLILLNSVYRKIISIKYFAPSKNLT